MPIEAPNTLRSRAKFKIVDIISQGPIKGIVNGAKSIYLDDTPVQNDDGSYNFPNFDVTRDVTELPVVVPTGSHTPIYSGIFPASENTVNVGVKVTKHSPEGSGSGDGSVTRTITDASLDAARVTLRIPALAITNTTTGDITGGQISFNIYVKPNGGDYSPIDAGAAWTNLTIGGNTLPESSGVELTVRLSGDRTTAKTITWQYAEVVGGIPGAWVTYATLDIPATSSSQQSSGFYNWSSNLGDFTRSVKYLGAGTYRVRAVTIGGTGTEISARQYQTIGLQIAGKTVSPYDVTYNVPLPDGGAPWDIKVQRWTSDNTASNFQDDLYWLAYTEVVDNRFSWPNIAGLRLAIDAESFGGNVPNRSYDVMGLMIQVPSNYDSYNRTYTGVWNGTFKTDWTDNPAWIFYDLLTNKRYGLGDNIDASQIDKYALYQISQYCDELVDAPNGEQEPRYTCSCVINSQSEAYELLTAIASAFRGMIYHSGGMITPVADMPSDPVLNVGPANVIDGIFTYQGASRKARHTVARVSWNNPDDGYKLNVELYEDTEAIRKYGYRPIDINAFGCTSRGLARRWGKWAIVSDNDAPDTVTYKAGFDHFNLRPGDVINIADPNYSGEQLFGLIVSVTDNASPATHTIKLDRAVTRVAGDTSELQLTLADGSILALDVAVLANTTSDEITVDSSELTTIPLVGASWLLKKGTVEPRQWRVISISEDEPHIYQVTAMLYDPNKYDSIETGLNFAEADFTAFPSGPLTAPTSLAISEFLKQSGSAILECATFSWVRPADARAELFEMQYQEDGKDWQATTPNLTGVTSVDIINIVPGTYNFRVRAQDSSGIFRSEWATLASQTLQGKNKAPENVTGFTASVEKFGVLLSWNKVSDIDIDYYEIRTGASWAAGTPIAKVKATTFKYEDATTGAYMFWIKALDTQTPANESATAASTSVTVSAQAAPSVVATAVNGGIQLTISGTTSRGFRAYEIQRKEYPSGTETTINSNVLTKIFTDTNIATLTYTKSWQYRVRALDQNGSASAWSSLTSATTPKQIENNDITANQIIAKDFRTACNAGNGTVSGVLFNANGIQAWNGATNTFCINAATGDVSMTGTITANNGLIGGWCIQPGCLCATNAKLYSGAANTARVEMGTGATSAGINSANAGTDISFWAGSTFANRASAPFNVTAAGSLTANCGKIANWFIKPNQLCAVATDGAIMAIGGNTGQPLIWLGASSGSNQVTIGECVYTGAWNPNKWGIVARFGAANLFQVHACCDGTSICASIAGWNFNATQIYSNGCGLILCNTGAIQTGLFQTGNQGWKIDSVGNAEFNNICARGAIRTAVFIKDEISVVGGCTMIRPATILNCAWTTSTATAWIYTDNTQYSVNDIVRLKDGSGNDYWGRVYTCGVIAGNPYIGIAYCFGTTGWDATKGQAIVNYGSCVGCGGIMLNGQCPYIDLYTHAGLPWNGTESRVRIGNLKGWGTIGVDTYGIAAGCPTGQYMTYDSVSGVLDIAGNINVKSTLPLVMPAGAVLELSAKGSTTATIALAGGVKDVSGNGNNGQAYNGVAVSDSIIGKVFQFDSAYEYIGIPQLGSDAPWTVSAWVARSAFANATWKSIIAVTSGTTHHLVLDVNYAVGLWDGSHKLFGYVVPDDGQFHALTVIYHNATSASLYADGVFVSTITINLNLNTYKFGKIGNWSGGGYHAGPIGNLKIFNRALTAEEVKTLYMLGNQQESGVITADRVQTGVLSSLNWSTSAGSCFNMNDGTFTLGGSSAPKLSWNGTTLNVVGNVTITGGSGIGNFSDANIDNIADGSTYKRTTQNEKTGAGRAYSGLDSSNRLITAVIPGTTLAPTTAGLFIGSNNLGYHNGTEWRTYMGSNGNFYLGGTGANKGLAWDALNNCLTVCGCITSCAGTIGGWTIASGYICRPNFLIGQDSIDKGCGLFMRTGPGAYLTAQITNGCFYDGSTWIAHSGIHMRNSIGVTFFRVSTCATTHGGDCAIIAGWNFNANCLYSGNLIMNSSGAIQGNYSGDVSGWCIDAAGNAKFNNATVRGVICACGGGNIGGFVIGTNMLCSTPAAGCSVGMSSCSTSGAIAFWAGCSTVACAPFRVTNTGALSATSGSIGGFTLASDTIYSSPLVDRSVGLSSSSAVGTIAIWAGCSTSANAPFRVDSSGCATIEKGWISCFTISHGFVYDRCPDGGICCMVCFRTDGITLGMVCNAVPVGANIAIRYAQNGSSAAFSPMLIGMAGTSCYAFCTNGRISVSGTVYPSDRNLKTDFREVSVLPQLRQLPITMWRFKQSKDYQIGPVAQDFNNIFRLNHDWQTNLTVGGLDGIALKAVKEVDENVQKLEKDNAAIRLKLQKLECEMAAIREMIN